MVDTHAHLHFDTFDSDREKVVQHCRRELNHIIEVGVSLETCHQAVQLAKEHLDIFAAVGIHPEDVPSSHNKIDDTISQLDQLIQKERSHIVAIGETGLDYYHTGATNEQVRKAQKTLFQRQLDLAHKYDLPIIIHSRDAFEDTFTVLKESAIQILRGVWHSFTGNPKQAQTITQLGLHVGINGIVTYSSARELQEAVKQISLDYVLLETDAPFLVPQVYRQQGIKRCEPWMVKAVAEKIADLKEIKANGVKATTDCNSRQLFHLAS